MYYLHAGITIVNIVLLTIILYYFYKTYREVKSRFSRGLMIFGAVLLINAILLFPLFYKLFTPSHMCPYEPFYTIAGGFEFVALLILLNLVRE
jgi:hypothetical protein